MRFDRAGRRLSHRFERTVIRSGYRLSYEEAQRILDGQASGHELAETLAAVNALARGLGERRRQSGSVDFGMSEVQIDLDDSGHPVNIRPKKRLDSHRLIEECMLIANRTVAEALADSRIDPFVSRIHEHPNPEKIAQLATYVRVFGYELPHEDGIVQPKDLNALLESVRDEPEAPVIEQAALRAMARARYAIEPIGHFGLAFDQYTHFTSPIRRYPDLIVHRLVHRMMVGAPGVDGAKLKDACDRSSERERVAVEAERASVELKQVVYAADHVGDDFEGVVAGVSRYGVYVELPALLVEGMVHVRDMDDDYYEYDERTFALVGLQTGKRFRPGDRVHVRLAAARIESREIDLAFIGPPKASRRSGSGPRGKRDAGSRRPERGGTGKRSKRRRR
jgi:ribonuclease R